jgi:hypothetical protein
LHEQFVWTRFCRNLNAASQWDRPIIVLQSSDRAYSPFLEITSGVNRSYCQLRGYAYAKYIGNASPRPHTANFNRYFMFREAIIRTRCRWAFWLDADALVVDPTVPLESIVDRSPDKLIIACRGRHNGEYDINNGVFFLNLRHHDANRFIRYLTTAASRVQRGNRRFQSDQKHVQTWLKRRMQASGRIACSRRYADQESNLFNYDGAFVRHVLRSSGTFEQRLARLRDLSEWGIARLRGEMSPLPKNGQTDELGLGDASLRSVTR